MQATEILQSAERLASLGEYETAIQLLDHVNGDDQQRAEILRGKVLAQQGRYQEAIAVWQKVLEAHPDATEVQAMVERAKRRTPSRLRVPTRVLMALAAAPLLIGLSVAAGIGVGYAIGSAERDALVQIRKQQRQMKDGLRDLRQQAAQMGHATKRRDVATVDELSRRLEALERQLAESLHQVHAGTTEQTSRLKALENTARDVRRMLHRSWKESRSPSSEPKPVTSTIETTPANRQLAKTAGMNPTTTVRHRDAKP